MRGVTLTPRGRWSLQAQPRQSRKARVKRIARWYCLIFNSSQFGKFRPRDTPMFWCMPLNFQLARLAQAKKRSQRVLLETPNKPLPPRQQEDFEELKQVKSFITLSDDERDFAAAQSYFARAESRRLQVGEVPPGGYHEPIGQFTSKEEEEKAYHKMFPHIIGRDGLCVYPHCRKPASEWDFDSAIDASIRYGDCFQSNFEEFQANRIKLQDAQDLWSTPGWTLKPEPPVPVPPVPEFPKKKKRRQNKAKTRATVNQAAPVNVNNTIVTDLHEINLFTTYFNDGLINDDSMFSEIDRLSLNTRPSSSSQVALVPVPGPGPAQDPNPDPHLHPLPPFYHIHSLPHHPSPSTLPLFSPTPSPLCLHPHSSSSQFSSSSLNPHTHVYDLDESDDDECGDNYMYY